MSSQNPVLVIVYQFGKVASTSLVNTLKKDPALDVHQSHFLGESALKRIIPIAVGHTTNAYFHEHLRGQLMANVELTYRMNRVLRAPEGEKLRVISLCREPLDWLRSGILQDIDGYRDDILRFTSEQECGGENQGERLRNGLAEILRRIAVIFDDLGGAETALKTYHEVGGKQLLPPKGYASDLIVRRLFFLALRPLAWFDEHFRSCFGFGLPEFAEQKGIWVAKRNRGEFVILRYEDIAEKLDAAIDAIGLCLAHPLQRKNVSKTKPFSDEVTSAFQTIAAEKLRSVLHASDYARYFGYAESKGPALAAE